MPQETEDQRAADAEFGPRARLRFGEAFNNRRNAHSAFRMGLRVEEQLGAAHVVGRGTLEVRPCHVLEVLRRDEHGRTRVVDVEETLQVLECVSGAQSLHARIRKPQVVAPGKREDQLGFERTLDVNVQFRLRRSFDQARQARASDSRRIEWQRISIHGFARKTASWLARAQL
jgi:hypothetical protein